MNLAFSIVTLVTSLKVNGATRARWVGAKADMVRVDLRRGRVLAVCSGVEEVSCSRKPQGELSGRQQFRKLQSKGSWMQKLWSVKEPDGSML